MTTEKRLIDANALVDKFWQEECRIQTRRDFVAMVDYAPTVDAVEVVRCIKCKRYDPESGYCQFWHGVRHFGQFCDEGERKDNE